MNKEGLDQRFQKIRQAAQDGRLMEWIDRALEECDREDQALDCKQPDYARTWPKDDMNEAEMVSWLEANIIPVSWPAARFPDGRLYATGPVYRAGVLLPGGFFLPCVAFAHPHYFDSIARTVRPGMEAEHLEAVRRHLLHPGNRIEPWAISKVLPSPYALRYDFFAEVQASGEWGHGSGQAFWAEMIDGTQWQFRCHDPMFVTLPSGYSQNHILAVRSGFLNTPSVMLQSGCGGYAGPVFSEQPYFWCFSEQIAVGSEVLEGTRE